MDALLLEANHDVNMLQVGPYPYPLKQRILGDRGHLSNENSGRLLCRLLHDNLKHIVLGHLSKENNIPQLAYETVRLEINQADNPYRAGDFPIQVARRSEEMCIRDSHRKPGLVGTAFRVRDIYGEIICDGCHSHLAALNNYFQAKGRDYALLITDSLCAKHFPPGGGYKLGGHDIVIGEDGLARLAGTDTIAGSTLHMNRGLRILVEEAMVPFDAAVNSCTINPARCLGAVSYTHLQSASA